MLTHSTEWEQSQINPSLTNLNQLSLSYEDEDTIAEFLFQNLERKDRRNDGRVRDSWINKNREALKGGWAGLSRDIRDLEREPYIACYKPDSRKPGVKYVLPARYNWKPIFCLISHAVAREIFEANGKNYDELLAKHHDTDAISEDECQWFWMEVLKQKDIAVSFTEGQKKALALLSHGQVAIAVHSVTLWHLKGTKGVLKQLHPDLALFAKGRKLSITFDHDTKVKTRKAVDKQVWQLGIRLERAGALSVTRPQWGSGKGIDDQLKTIVDCGISPQHYLNRLIELSSSYKYYKKKESLNSKEVRVNERFLQAYHVQEHPHKILVLKSGKGTGKTQLISEIVSENHYKAKPTINISYLEKLARELGIRLGLPYRTERGKISEKTSFGYSLCIDSLSVKSSYPFKVEEWDDAGIVVDETTQVLNHLSMGTTTVKDRRQEVTENLGKFLASCYINNNHIILADADMDRNSIDFIYELIKQYAKQDYGVEVTDKELDKETLAIVNEYDIEKGDLFFFEDKNCNRMRAILNKKMKAKENLFLLTSGQKHTSQHGTINLEKQALRYYKESEILRIDSETTSDPEHPAYAIEGKELAEKIKQGIYKMVISSPSICTGISIDGVNGYFDAVFSFQMGNLSTNSVRQQLVRLRDFKVPRYVWSRKTPCVYHTNSRACSPIQILKEEKTTAKLSLMGVASINRLIEENIDPLTTYWANHAALQNKKAHSYREYLKEELKEEKYNVVTESDNMDTSLEETEQAKAWAKAIKEESVAKHNKDVSSSEPLTAKERNTLKRKKALTKEERNQVKKFDLETLYKQEVKPELVEAHDKGLYRPLRAKFFFSEGREYMVSNNKAKIEEYLEGNDGRVYIPGVNRSSYCAIVTILDLIDKNSNGIISKALDDSQLEFSNHSKELIKLKEFCLSCRDQLKYLLGIAVSDNLTPIQIFNKLLKVLGRKVTQKRYERLSPTERLRVYGNCSPRSISSQQERDIIQSWLSREKVKAEVLAAQQVEEELG